MTRSPDGPVPDGPILEAATLDVGGINKSFDDVPVLHDVSLRVAPGEMVALLGPSGCGKTTLLRTIAGLEAPDAGSVTVGDTVVADDTRWVAPEDRPVGMVFQDWALFPHLSVGENVAYGLHRRDDHERRVAEVLGLVGLDGFEDRRPDTLSGGQQQRVALARALAPRPSVLLLDEPFSNLDSTLRVSVRGEVYRLLADLGITAVFVTHDQEEAFVLGDRVAVVHDGRVEQVGTPAELYRSPATRWIASFVGDINFVAAEAEGGRAVTAFGEVTLTQPMHGPVDVGLRPEQLELTSGDQAVVIRTEYYGHDAMAEVEADGLVIAVRTSADVMFERGDRVAISPTGEPALAFPRGGR